jgi:hypothetical protein
MALSRDQHGDLLAYALRFELLVLMMQFWDAEVSQLQLH